MRVWIVVVLSWAVTAAAHTASSGEAARQTRQPAAQALGGAPAHEIGAARQSAVNGQAALGMLAAVQTASAPGAERQRGAAEPAPADGAQKATQASGGAAQANGGAGQASADAQPRPLFERVVERARALAGRPYQAGDGELPAALDQLDYQGYRDIRFKKERALWGKSSTFHVEFFHPGFLYKHPVTIHEVVDGEVRPVAFDAGQFDYGKNGRIENLPRDLGFAGFRVHYPLHNANYKDELIAFLGASYFRMVGRNQHYGLSARGLAVDTAVPSGEEFPRFEEFWLVRPKPDANRMRFFALLNSPSVTGAYEFVLESGVDTIVDVRTRLFARNDVNRLGVAPLTSMFAWGENGVRHFDDYRPEVHDSDGLLQHRGAGEWIWRPLTNPPALQVSSLLDRMPQGFGLMQRDRNFDHYQDGEARYDRRPGLWVTPGAGDWGSGAVQLVEIPTDDETNDNIVAYWVSDEPFEAGDSRHFEYRMRTVAEMPNRSGMARVVSTRNGWGWVPGSAEPPPQSLRQFVVDFDGGELSGLADNQPVQADLVIHRGKARDLTVHRLPETGVWRVAFKLAPAGLEQTVDMRLNLTLRGRRISETWSYVWNPASVQQS